MSTGMAQSPDLPPSAIRWTRSARIQMLEHEGSWASHLGEAPSTVVSEIRGAISRDVNYASDVRRGVGTSGGFIDKWIGGVLGTGLMLSVMESFIHLAENYGFGDIIIITGFSRGSCAARILAAVISVVGIPRTHKLSSSNKNRLYQRIHKGLVSGDLWIPTRLAEIRDGYKFYDNAPIEALCIFDTVTSIGLPKSGIGCPLKPFLKRLPGLREEYAHLEDIIRDIPSNVKHFWHAISVHETRATYHEQIARQTQIIAGQIFKQMWFFGNHGNLAQDNGRSCIVDAPFAWMLGQIHHYLPHIRLDEQFLHRRFPLYPRSMNVTTATRVSPISEQQSGVAQAEASSSNATGPLNTAVDTSPDAINLVPFDPPPPHFPFPLHPPPCRPWIHDPVRGPSIYTNILHGYHQRTPGGYGFHTNEAIHRTVRLRGFGRNRNEICMIPGYLPAENEDGSWEWRREADERARARTGSWRGGERIVERSPVIAEDEMTVLENALLGFT